MNIKINETGETKTLSIIDPKTGINWVQDLVGNAGAFADGQFVWSENDNAYLADESSYEWWADYISDYETTTGEVGTLADELSVSPDDIWMQIANHMHADYEQHRRDAVRTIQQLRADHYASLIYTAIFGDLDDKHFRAQKTAEINDWLCDGEPDYSDVESLITEWRTYDADDIAERVA